MEGFDIGSNILMVMVVVIIVGSIDYVCSGCDGVGRVCRIGRSL